MLHNLPGGIDCGQIYRHENRRAGNQRSNIAPSSPEHLDTLENKLSVEVLVGLIFDVGEATQERRIVQCVRASRLVVLGSRLTRHAWTAFTANSTSIYTLYALHSDIAH